MRYGVQRFLQAAAGIVFMVVYLLDVEVVSSLRGLDLSWHTMLGYAHENRLQHGTELIFNYGPLSFIESAVYFENTHLEKLIFRGVFLAVLGVGVFSVLQVTTVWRLLAWCGLTLLLLMLRDVYLLLPALLLVHQECRRQAGDRWQLSVSVLLAFGAAFACLVKSNAVFFTVPALLLATLYRLSLRDRSLAVPLGFALSTAFLFWVSGQALSNFPAFVAGYLDVSRAHNEDMTLAAPALPHATFLFGAAVVASTLRFTHRKESVLGALTLGYLLVAYKMGFIRHGSHPEAAFLALAFVGAVQLWSGEGHFHHRAHRVLVAGGVAAAAAFVASSALFASLLPHGEPLKGYAQVVQNRFRYAVDPAFRAASNAEAQRRFVTGLNEARAAIPPGVEQGPIDVFPFEFSLAYASGMPVASRPAFQSYYATSRLMTERNARFLASEQAPSTVIFGIAPIDGRYAALEDPLALRAFRQAYQVQAKHSDAVLLTRRARPLQVSSACHSSEFRWDERIDIPAVAPGQAVWAEIVMKPRAVGRLVGLFAGHPAITMTLATPDGDARYRTLREAAEVGFLLSPALVSNDAAAHFLGGASRPQDSVRGLTLHRPSGPVPWFDETVSARLCVLSWRTAP